MKTVPYAVKQEAYAIPANHARNGKMNIPTVEGETLRGKKAIESWIVKTIEKYKFQFKPLSVKDDDGEVVVAVEVSETFDGSPVTLDYHFTVENDQILSLAVK